MTEQEEAVGRQRLEVLTALEKRLVALETDATVLYAEPHERHARAQKDYDELAAIIGRLEKDPFIPLVRILDAELAVTATSERLAEADKALLVHMAEAEKELATRQAAVDTATTELTEAQSALTALQTP